MKVELFINGEALDAADDKKLISQIPLRDKTVRVFIGWLLFLFESFSPPLYLVFIIPNS